MSYKLYIEGYEMELKDISRLAQTKQRNNITNLHQRQSNATNNFALPKTPNNVKHMQYLGVVGNKSTRPYKKLKASLQDTITGEWLIYNGWANVTSTANDYKITLYDGIIDFYKAIDNKTLTDVIISGLNHIKNLANVKASFANTLPYMYILSDFNGALYDVGTLNIDYQVPSARMSYIWDRIHQFAGFTYSGAIFATQKFKNWFMTFPKPVPSSIPNYVNVETHNASTVTSTYSYWDGYVNFTGTQQSVNLFPNIITGNAYVTSQGSQYKFLQAGVFKVGATGSIQVTTNFIFVETTNYTVINYSHINSAGVLQSSGTFDTAGLGYVILTVLVGDKVFLSMAGSAGGGGSLGTASLSQNVVLNLDLLGGYQANFDDVLVDFLATDFVKEVLNHFALTPFKDKYSNHIEYRTFKEIIQEPDVIDWSDKNPVRLSEKYFIGSYAQSNEFTYRYDEETLKYNNGRILIDNQNLKENTVVVQSKLYTPSLEQTTINGQSVNIYKIWEKEINDAGVVEYKELSGRFYTIRYSMVVNQTIYLKSKATAQTTTYTGNVPYGSNWRLNWDAVLTDNYKQITQMLNTAKVVEANLYLTSKDVANFDFKRLIYIEQWSSYYIVNKIMNFIKDKYTKVELIEVDYYTEDDGINYTIPYTYITITNVVSNGCQITVTFDTDAVLPTTIYAEITQIGFAVIGSNILGVDTYTVNATSFTVSFAFTGVVFNEPMQTTNIKLYLGFAGIGLASNSVPVNIANCVIPPDCTYINLISLVTIAVIPQMILSDRRIRVTFASDLVLPHMMRFTYDGGFFIGVQYRDIMVTANVFEIDIPHDSMSFFGGGNTVNPYNCKLSQGTINSNYLPSAS